MMTRAVESYPVGLAAKLKLAVPTDLPCCEMTKLADWAEAAGASVRNAASGMRANLRMILSIKSILWT